MVLPVVSTAAVATPTPLASTTAPVPAADRVQLFEDAMQRQNGAVAATAPAPVVSQPPVAATGQVDAAGALDRARQGFGLQGVPGAVPPPASGDMILEGMQKLRGVFDRSEGRVSDVMSRGSTDAGSLMQMQLELTNFTLLVDLSSKLTGKTTQVFDTLMKGQ
ncbi:type III secretion system inner rod subunit SctI [Aureimonas jatrophae]|uniref:Type III secretion apparatus protein, YscI/HrpB, C-terminal domain-containing protein n=1 Tax=Aureimonas jatrophae TaxID=1166073 RepID=A0A1H0ET84_9HYPH|nr:type III secretion system inner rod subunit SctI [Aureimonas jatrophae]MBB3950325.1 type III secretion system YscI/HrpB-like protein [Aureimonas jatrophae]SDN85588.1 type III secretion apparatus protein, YscI/HrpB, C-terminal domain-containing protein [Aureimonas jatrophae]